MPRRPKTLGDDHFKRIISVVVDDVGGNLKGDDGRLVHDPLIANSFYNSIVYNLILERMDGKWTCALAWVDKDNVGHRIVLPHEVCTALFRNHASINKESRSLGAKKAYQTRVEQGNEPPTIQETLNKIIGE